MAQPTDWTRSCSSTSPTCAAAAARAAKARWAGSEHHYQCPVLRKPAIAKPRLGASWRIRNEGYCTILAAGSL